MNKWPALKASNEVFRLGSPGPGGSSIPTAQGPISRAKHPHPELVAVNPHRTGAYISADSASTSRIVAVNPHRTGAYIAMSRRPQCLWVAVNPHRTGAYIPFHAKPCFHASSGVFSHRGILYAMASADFSTRCRARRCALVGFLSFTTPQPSMAFVARFIAPFSSLSCSVPHSGHVHLNPGSASFW